MTFQSFSFPPLRHLMNMEAGFRSICWCHQRNHCHDISREALLCAISIVTWNFSFELVLSFALFRLGL